MDIRKLLEKIREARRRKILEKYFGKVIEEREKEIKAKKPSIISAPQVIIEGMPVTSKAPAKIGGPIIFTYKPLELPEEEIIEKEIRSLILPREVTKELQRVHERKPLIYIEFEGKRKAMAFCEIKWDKEMQSLIYRVIEPKLDEKEKKALEEIKNYIEEKLDIDFTAIKNVEEAFEYIKEKFREGVKKIGLKFNEEQKFKLLYYLYRDLIGLEKIEPLMRDPDIEDISCGGVGLPIFIYHRNPLYGEMPTNIVFTSAEELDNFIIKLAQRCGRSISVAKPLLDGSLPDGSRVQCTLGTDIARRGSNFTIRKFFRRILIPTDLISNNTLNEILFSYLWLLVEAKMNILIAGPTASGKTTLLNCLCLFIRPEMKIVSIEDTAEIRLPHPNWVPHVSREAFGPHGYGKVTLFDLLKASLRQRPDYIIVGEVRGREAYVMFQAMAIGHACMGTIHAEDLDTIISRLTTPPINLPKSLLANLDAVVFLTATKIRGKFSRRVSNITEITGFDPRRNRVLRKISFKWIPAEDKFQSQGSEILEKAGKRLGLESTELVEELRRRALLLKWLTEKGIRDYKEFWRYIGLYYYNPEELSKIMRK